MNNKGIVLRKQHDLLKITLITIIVSYYLFVFIQQLTLILDDKLVQANQRQLFPYYQVTDPALFANDYITSFLSSGNLPLLYDLLTRFWLSLDGDLQIFHHVMLVILWILMLISISLAGWKAKGMIASLGALGLVLMQPLFLQQITSVTPHAFAFPLLGWTIVALLYGNVTGLVVLTLLSSVLYFPVTPIIGLSLAVFMALQHKKELKKLNTSKITRVIAIVGITGCLSIILGLPVLQPKEGFGEPLVPFQEVKQFPENGETGRLFLGVNEPLFYVTAVFINQFQESISKKTGFGLLLVYLNLALLGYLVLARKSLLRQRLGIFIIASLAVASLILIFKPIEVYRFFLYPFLIILAILVPVAIANVFSHCKNKHCALSLPLLLLFLFTLTLDGNNKDKIGYSFAIDEESTGVLTFVKSLPADVLIAGWPDYSLSGNINEHIPYLSKRRVLIMGVAHYPDYKGYLLEMRNRMYALINAYSATDEKPIKMLQDNFGVDYLLIDKRYFAEENPGPEYFAPFKDYLLNIWDTRKINGFILADAALYGKVFETENYFLLDISKFLAKSNAPKIEDIKKT